ncbi:MAG: hypothetical protein ACI4J3_00455 [Oscillospiraceae bacterium]
MPHVSQSETVQFGEAKRGAAKRGAAKRGAAKHAQPRARPNIRPDHNGTQRAQFESNKRITPACAGNSMALQM